VSISYSPALAAATALFALLTLAVPARAAYDLGAEPVSATAAELGDLDSTSPSISGNGRFVVFRTESSILLGPSPDPSQPLAAGLVRKDLLTGALALVAPPGAGGATSISDDGRYVLFETTDTLAAGDTNTRRDVYLRDMTRQLSSIDAYELVSSLDGPEQSPVYPTAGTGGRTGIRGFSLSGDGRTALFWTDGPSNLPAGGATTTPRAQVFVRSLARGETRLVTRDKADPGLPGTPVPAEGEFATTVVPNPVLSGDGTTVAWQDTHPASQTTFLPGQPTQGPAFLWRKMTSGPQAPARRLTGIADPDDPACSLSAPYIQSETATGPCYGPFASSEAKALNTVDLTNYPLSISDDGRRVLMMSDAKRRPYRVQFQRRGLFVVDMSPGVSRKRGTVESVSVSKALTDAGRGILSAVLAGDGRHIAFVSRNNAFDGPRPFGTFQTGELIATNVFVLDLAANSVERATRSFAGRDYQGALLDPEIGTTDDTRVDELAVSTDASAIAFQAADGNLFVGDANGVPDVQVVRRSAATTPIGLEPQPSAPDGPPKEPPVNPLRPIHPLIGYVQVRRGGVATLRVRLPAAGRLTAEARAGRRLLVAKLARRLKRPATLTLSLRPSRAARAALRRGTRLNVVVRLRYVPRRGAGTRASRRYTLGATG
jgi:hypothetical protein